MNSLERKQFIEKKCYQKNINLETQEYIKQYISLNESLFVNFLDVDDVTKKLLENLNKSISMIPTKPSELIRGSGTWKGGKHYIYINPINKILSIFFKSEKYKLNSIIMHELDHCATSEYISISEQEKNNIIETIINKNKIKRKDKVKNYINNKYKKNKGLLPISGISDIRQSIHNNVNLTPLNEGITAWKQEMYEKQLGIRPYRVYSFEKEVSKFISDMIGKENLIKMHFNHDYEGIRQLFKENTGTELNCLVEKLNNKPRFNILLNNIPIVRKIYKRNFNTKRREFYTDIQQSMQDIKKQNQEKRRTDFIPKIDVKHQTTDFNTQRKNDNHKENSELPEVESR